MRALDDLIEAGKVRYIGSSQFLGWEIAAAHYEAERAGVNRFITTQGHYSLLERAVCTEVVPACEEYGVGLLPFWPLASGVLSGKYALGQDAPEGSRLAKNQVLADMFLTTENLALAGKLEKIAQSHGKELIDLAFAWLLCSPVVPSVIAGASTPAQIARNVDAVAWQLDEAVIAEIAAVLA